MIMMGRDELNAVAPEYYDALDNAERVAEEMHVLRDGVNLGWPYTYWDPYKNARMLAPEFGGDNRQRAPLGRYDAPVMAFPAHWAPLQMAFYPGGQFPARYKNGAFIAFHGSLNRAPLPQAGYNIVFAPFDEHGRPVGTFEVFADAAGPTVMPFGGVAVGGTSGGSAIPANPRARRPRPRRRHRLGHRRSSPCPAATPTPNTVRPATWLTATAPCQCSPRSRAAKSSPEIRHASSRSCSAVRLPCCPLIARNIPTSCLHSTCSATPSWRIS